MFRTSALVLLLCSSPIIAAEPTRHEWTVVDATREGLVYIPEKDKTQAAPVVFAFHGHGGTMNNAAQKYDFHKHWPEAICVYLQGLPTPGKLTDLDGKKPGWQHSAGDQADRDLKFFDTVLAWLKKEHKVDEKRIYCMGHSNGGAFSYLLWAKRGDNFAALAPSAATISRKMDSELKPKPVLHLAGENDELVKFEWQKLTIEAVRKLNSCESTGKSWEKKGTEYPSKTGNPVVTFLHKGGHGFPDDAMPIIVKFFQAHSQK
jgi:polyhydroxybutyrate depolymerase